MKIVSSVNRLLSASSAYTLKASGEIYNRLLASVSTGVFQLIRVITDNASISESGVIRVQGYTDSMTYFEDDYVGSKETF